VPSVKVHELTKFHAEFPAGSPALYTTAFVMAMNKPRYEGLATDLKKVIDANSGLATSGWLGQVQQGNDPGGRKSATDRNNAIHTFSAAETQEFIQLSSSVDDEWVADMDKRGFKGQALLDSAKALIAKHGKA
jgi:TRAP-type C4-dicarboxylate transport system substrate-binding protein